MHTSMMRCAFILLALPTAIAQCPNLCNGHGRCVAVNQCECFGQWAGGDCSMRKCPTGKSWADVPSAEDTAHAEVDCSNRGVCNSRTGECDCMPGYEGLACNRMVCPGDCSGNGECHSMKHHAQTVDKGTLPLPNPQKSARPPFAYASNWDADMIQGCTCDAGYEGWECSSRRCAWGDDPMTTTQLDEVQLIRCDLPATPSVDTFRLSFRGQMTGPIKSDALAADIKSALEALSSVGEVTVAYTGTGTTFCDDSAAPAQPSSAHVVSFTFTTQHGSLPRIIVTDELGKPLTGTEDNAVFTAAKGESLSHSGGSVLSVTGTKEDLPCSGRGRCNDKTGMCSCFTGFTASDGKVSRGDIPDCGYAYLPVTSCPGGALECSGHGTCSGSPEYRCTCYEGWQGGDCGERSCAKGPAWFDYPTATDTAHGLAECSNKGKCDRESGKCACQAMFQGAACERMVCPGASAGGVCSGHGQCLSMSAMADLSTINGDPEPTLYGMNPGNPGAWDGDSVYGCKCDEGYTGYDCSARTCAKGNDITLLEGNPSLKDEVQQLGCKYLGAGTPTFRLSFRGAVTRALPYNAPQADVEAALKALSTVDDISVIYGEIGGAVPATNEACHPTAASPPYRITIQFKTEHGDVPPVRVVLDEAGKDGVTGSYGAGSGWDKTQLEWIAGSATDYAVAVTYPVTVPTASGTTQGFPATGLRAIEKSKGLSIDEECSARGICDRETGTCQCFLGFGASNDNRAAGIVENCGWREPYVWPKSLRG